MPPSVTRGFTVPHIPTSKNSDDSSRPPTTINRPRSAKPTKINTPALDHSAYLDPTWPASTPLQRKYPVLTRQSQRALMSSHPTLPIQNASSPPIPQPSVAQPPPPRQLAQHVPVSASQPPIPNHHQQTPSVPSPHQHALSAHAQPPPPNQHLRQLQAAHPQLAQHVPQKQEQQQTQEQPQQQHSQAYATSPPSHHPMYSHRQQIPPQQMRRQVPSQPPASQPTRLAHPNHLASQHMVSARQIKSHQTIEQRQKPAALRHARQYVGVHQTNQDAQRLQLQHKYRTARMQNPQAAHLAHVPASNAPYPLTAPKNDLTHHYSQPTAQPVHLTQQKEQKISVQGSRAAGIHQQQISAQQVHQRQQAISQQMHMAQSSSGMNNANQISAMRGGNIHNGQLYPAALGIPTGAMQSAGIQYPSSYANTGIFDPLNMNSAGLSLSTVNVHQPGTNQVVNATRDLERQSQNSQLPQTAGRAGVHVNERNGVKAQDVHSYTDQAPQLMHRASMHPSQQDFQDHTLPQHHVQSNMYQPVEQQQNAQHLAMNQGQGLPPPQGSVVVQNNQTTHLSQPSTAADEQLNQQMYPATAQNQLAGFTPSDVQQIGDMSSRKAAAATTQQELLQWHNNNSSSRAMNSGLPPQKNGGIPTAMPTGPIISQSQLLEMNVADGRHPRQSNISQLTPPAGIQTAPDQRSLGQTRRLPASGDDGSPRKRRQLGPGTPSPLESSRTYPCSGCGQDFARKRDRDNHVRTVHERSFRCSKCESRFKTKSDANRHVRIVHDRVRPYKCPLCPSMFSERNKLRRHKETVHEKRRPYVCPVCSARFGELGNLRQHTASLHPEYQTGSGSNPGRSRVNHQVQS